MKNILIAVPTKGRLDTIGKETLLWLPKVEYDWKLFIEPCEIGLYGKFFPSLKDHFVDIGENGRGLAFVMLFIREYAKKHEYEMVFKIDDDLKGWAGRERKMVKGNIVPFTEAMIACLKKMEDPKVGGISFPYAHQMFNVAEAWAKKGRFNTAYIVRVKHWYVKLEVFNEDLAGFISLRANGLEVPRYNWLGMAFRAVETNSGGCQLFDRKKLMDVSNAALQKDFPFLKLKKVDDKTWTHEPDMRSVP